MIGKSKGFIQEAVPDMLKMVGLGGKQGRFPHELSGGEQQRVAIARAIVNKPAILLADEPTGNLDPATSAGHHAAAARRINVGGTTVLMATHDSGIVDQMKRRVIELVSGQIVRDERSADTRRRPFRCRTSTSPAAWSRAVRRRRNRRRAWWLRRRLRRPTPPAPATAPETAAPAAARATAEAPSAPPPLNEPERRA